MEITVNLLLIAVTVLVSLTAPAGSALFERFMHYPYREARYGEYQRWLTAGFLHANLPHLLFNMVTLYFFGPIVEGWLQHILGETLGGPAYALFYMLVMVAASAGTFFKYRDNAYFSSIGASGAVAGVLFASILIYPTIKIFIFFIPIGIPGFIFGPLYLWYSTYAAKQGRDNIDHLAHFYGAVCGFLLPLLLNPWLLPRFVQQMVAWFIY